MVWCQQTQVAMERWCGGRCCSSSGFSLWHLDIRINVPANTNRNCGAVLASVDGYISKCCSSGKLDSRRRCWLWSDMRLPSTLISLTVVFSICCGFIYIHKVNKMWAGLGYYRRAQQLLKGAHKVFYHWPNRLRQSLSKIMTDSARSSKTTDQ